MTENLPPQDGRPNAENFGFEIRGLRVGDRDDFLELPGAGSVIAVVGANNVGKSTFLRQITQLLESRSLVSLIFPRVVTELREPWVGTRSDMEAWLHVHSYTTVREDGSVILHRAGSGHLVTDAMSVRGGQGSTPQFITNWFVNKQDALNRSYMCAATERPDPIGAPPQHPMQIFHKDLAKRERLESLAKRLFGITLHFDTMSKNVGFRVGDPGVAVPLADQIDVDYVDALARLSPLVDQGDGVKSALGMVIPLIATDFPVTLIDEPEAFLHPPQAKIMGSEIASLARANNSQVFLSTHDKNIVVGLVESDTPVTIIHLTREGEETAAKLLSSDKVAELWTDVTLRYGDALNGLFHRAVIVTEGDRDSRFYNAAIDAIGDSRSPKPSAHNLMFLGSNGKQNMPPIVARLRELGIRVVSTPDLDILNNDKLLAKLVGAHGGDWHELAALYKRATSEFKGNPQPPSVKKVKQNLAELLNRRADTELVTEQLSEKLTAAVKIPATKWSQLKEFGVAAFKNDKAAATQLLDALDALGIVVVRVGVLENFAEDVTAPKGPEFLTIALHANVHRTLAAKAHAERLLSAAGIGNDAE